MTNLAVPLSFNQIFELAKQLPANERSRLAQMLRRPSKNEEKIETFLASEQVLSKDWLNPDEEKAWQNL